MRHGAKQEMERENVLGTQFNLSHAQACARRWKTVKKRIARRIRHLHNRKCHQEALKHLHEPSQLATLKNRAVSACDSENSAKEEMLSASNTIKRKLDCRNVKFRRSLTGMKESTMKPHPARKAQADNKPRKINRIHRREERNDQRTRTDRVGIVASIAIVLEQSVCLNSLNILCLLRNEGFLSFRCEPLYFCAYQKVERSPCTTL